MTVVIGVQRRFMQLGRVRLGEKGPNGAPKKLSTFRFTSASERLLNAVAAKYGGTVHPWEGAPDAGYFEVTTTASSLDIILPPTFSEVDGTPSTSYSQFYELWSRGGCQRRCDGMTESLTGKTCMCDAAVRDAGTVPKGTCSIITRVSFIIPDLPGLGVWRLDSGGWNAAVELPGTLSLLAQAAQEQRFIPAVLSLQNRTSKKDGQTRRFVVPVIELPDVTIGQLVSGTAPTLALNTPAAPAGKPQLPAAPAPPADNGFDNGTPGFGARPALPSLEGPDAGVDETPETHTDNPPVSPDRGAVGASGSSSDGDLEISEAQRRRLRAIQTRCGVPDDVLRALVWDISGVESSKLIPLRTYDALVAALEERSS